MNNDLQRALDNFRCNATKYAKYQRYYDGNHDLAFATEKFQNTFGNLFREFALNLCPVVCDAVRDKLRISGLRRNAGILPAVVDTHDHRADGISTLGSSNTQASSLRSDAESIWQRSRMGLRCGEVHKEALRSGDEYVIVWPGASGKATLFPNRAANITVQYDDEGTGNILWAAKWWTTRDKRVRVNLFYPDRVERYVSKTETDVIVSDARSFVAVPGPKSSGRRCWTWAFGLGTRDYRQPVRRRAGVPFC